MKHLDRKQVIIELEVLLEWFESERDAYPLCLLEAIQLLEEDGKNKEKE